MASSRLEKLRTRRMDPLVKVAGLSEVYERLRAEGSSVKYAIGAMQPIDPEYTKRTIEERKRVEDQLAKGFIQVGLGVTFDYQGSVTSDTHVRVYSDVDLLTVETRWYGLEPPQQPSVPYLGNAIEDLRELRNTTVKILRLAFPAATVDQSGSKAITISDGSLRRKIDVIACAWWDTNEYSRFRQKYFRGIEIFDNDKGQRVPNKPFLHNKQIDERDVATNGGLRKLIRLLKSLNYDNDEKIDMSSYDIAGIVYNMFDNWLTSVAGYDLQLMKACRDYLQYLAYDKSYRDSIEMPNKMRKVFCAEGASAQGLIQLIAAMNTLVAEIEQDLGPLRKLIEARVTY